MQSPFRIILGLTSLIIGLIIFVWVVYNIFIERNETYSGPRSLLELLIGGIGIPGLLFKYGWHSLLILLKIKDKDFEL